MYQLLIEKLVFLIQIIDDMILFEIFHLTDELDLVLPVDLEKQKN
jgi:hypothetical protein